MAIEQLVQDCDLLIQGGQTEAAAKRLNTINTTTVPRELRLRLAGVCRRAGLLTAGLKVLGPVVHPVKDTWGADASQAELAEYAELLRACGAVREALDTLDKVNPNAQPEAYFYRAQCHIDTWNFKEAVVHLELYLSREDVTGDQRAAGALKLATCRMNLADYEQAASITTELAENMATAPRARAAALEIRAQIHLHNKRYQAARADLTAGAQDGLDAFQLHKWATIAGALEKNDKSALEVFRREAVSQRAWEDVRDADFFALKIEFSEERFELLMFGTPYSSFRKVTGQALNRAISKSEFIFGDSGAPTLDLITGRRAGGPLEEAPPRLVHRLISGLLRDFYHPISTGALFTELFPDEAFDVFSSIHRVHQAIHRARKWIESQNIPVVIVETRGHYSLSVVGSFAVCVPYERVTLDTEARRFQALLGHFQDRGFTARQARQALGLTPAVFKSLMTWAEEAGHVARMGAGPSTRYRIVTAGGQSRSA